VLSSSRVQELTEDATIRGTVPEADQQKMTFEVQLVEGRRVTAPIGAQHLDAIIEAFNGYKSGSRVLLQGIGRFNRNERLLSFDSIEHVSLLDALDIPARLDELRLLEDGWLEGRGIAPTDTGLDWLSDAFGRHYPDDLPLPHLYPTAEGAIRAEWSLGQNDISLEIEIDIGNRSGEWHRLSIDSDAEESRTLQLDLDEDWNWLVNQIRQFAGGAA
jgi:hypothetical protein